MLERPCFQRFRENILHTDFFFDRVADSGRFPPASLGASAINLFYLVMRMTMSEDSFVRYLKRQARSCSSAVEHILGKDEVTGSIPVMSSRAKHKTTNDQLDLK